MRIGNSRLIGMAAAALVLAAMPVLAQGKSKSHDNGKAKGKKGDVVVVESHGTVTKVPHGTGTKVPPGLAKKPGQMPPGQYKKLYTPVQGVDVLRDVLGRNGYTYVRSAPYGEGRYVWYRAPNGTVQRAIVVPGAERLSFSNVPALVLQQVIAKLY
jgi:hypothetical protein